MLHDFTFFALDFFANCIDAVFSAAFDVISSWLGRAMRTLKGNATEKKKVVIIGGGFAGLSAQRAFCEYHRRNHFEVTVIDKNNFFEYTPGILRVFVNPMYFWKVSGRMPTRRSKFIHGEVVKIHAGDTTGFVMVQLAGDDSEIIEVDYDFLLIASGSTYEQPIKPIQARENTRQLRFERLKVEAEKVRQAQSIVVVGGGPVGVELAAEILTQYPDKHVILTDRNETLCHMLPQKSKDYIRKWFERQNNCELVLGWSVGGDYPHNLAIDDHNVTLSSGRILTGDLVFKCMGFKPNARFYFDSKIDSQQEHDDRTTQASSYSSMAATDSSSSQPSQMTYNANTIVDAPFQDNKETQPKNYEGAPIVVLDSLQVSGAPPNVFAMGDCMYHASSKDVKLAHTAELNAHLVVENVVRLKKSKDKMLMSARKGSVNSIMRTKESSAQCVELPVLSLLGTYPQSVVSNTRVPQIFAISLGEFDCSMVFNNVTINGPPAVMMKHLVEVTKVAANSESVLGQIFWKVSDPMANFISKYIIPKQ